MPVIRYRNIKSLPIECLVETMTSWYSLAPPPFLVCWKIFIFLNNSWSAHLAEWRIYHILFIIKSFQQSLKWCIICIFTKDYLKINVQLHITWIRSIYHLTHWGRVTNTCISKLHHWFRKWLVAWSAPSHYLKQCWDIANSNIKNKLEWNPKQNFYIFIQ